MIFGQQQSHMTNLIIWDCCWPKNSGSRWQKKDQSNIFFFVEEDKFLKKLKINIFIEISIKYEQWDWNKILKFKKNIYIKKI